MLIAAGHQLGIELLAEHLDAIDILEANGHGARPGALFEKMGQNTITRSRVEMYSDPIIGKVVKLKASSEA